MNKKLLIISLIVVFLILVFYFVGIPCHYIIKTTDDIYAKVENIQVGMGGLYDEYLTYGNFSFFDDQMLREQRISQEIDNQFLSAIKEADEFRVPAKPVRFSSVFAEYYSGKTTELLINSSIFVVRIPSETNDARKSADIANKVWKNLTTYGELEYYGKELELEVSILYEKYLVEKKGLPVASSESKRQFIEDAGEGMVICCRTKKIAVEGIIDLGKKLGEVRTNATKDEFNIIANLDSINETIGSRIIRLEILKYDLEKELDNLNRSRSSDYGDGSGDLKNVVNSKPLV